MINTFDLVFISTVSLIVFLFIIAIQYIIEMIK